MISAVARCDALCWAGGRNGAAAAKRRESEGQERRCEAERLLREESGLDFKCNSIFECVTLYVQEKSMAEELKALGAVAALQVSASARA